MTTNGTHVKDRELLTNTRPAPDAALMAAVSGADWRTTECVIEGDRRDRWRIKHAPTWGAWNNVLNSKGDGTFEGGWLPAADYGGYWYDRAEAKTVLASIPDTARPSPRPDAVRDAANDDCSRTTDEPAWLSDIAIEEDGGKLSAKLGHHMLWSDSHKAGHWYVPARCPGVDFFCWTSIDEIRTAAAKLGPPKGWVKAAPTIKVHISSTGQAVKLRVDRFIKAEAHSQYGICAVWYTLDNGSRDFWFVRESVAAVSAMVEIARRNGTAVETLRCQEPDAAVLPDPFDGGCPDDSGLVADAYEIGTTTKSVQFLHALADECERFGGEYGAGRATGIRETLREFTLGDQDAPMCRRQFPDGSVPGNIREAAEGWQRAYDELWKKHHGGNGTASANTQAAPEVPSPAPFENPLGDVFTEGATVEPCLSPGCHFIVHALDADRLLFVSLSGKLGSHKVSRESLRWWRIARERMNEPASHHGDTGYLQGLARAQEIVQETIGGHGPSSAIVGAIANEIAKHK